MKKYVLFIVITCNLYASSLISYKTIIGKILKYSTSQSLLIDVLSYISEYLFENDKNTVILNEKKLYYKPIEYRNALKDSIMGYLGAYYNHNIKIEPYAYAFVSNHSRKKVLQDFIKHNELNELINNIEQGTYSQVIFKDPRFKFLKIDKYNYKISIIYRLDGYHKHILNHKYLVKTILNVEIDPNRSDFYFYIKELSNQFKELKI